MKPEGHKKAKHGFKKRPVVKVYLMISLESQLVVTV